MVALTSLGSMWVLLLLVASLANEANPAPDYARMAAGLFGLAVASYLIRRRRGVARRSALLTALAVVAGSCVTAWLAAVLLFVGLATLS